MPPTTASTAAKEVALSKPDGGGESGNGWPTGPAPQIYLAQASQQEAPAIACLHRNRLKCDLAEP
jgi:hypothetical protein